MLFRSERVIKRVCTEPRSNNHGQRGCACRSELFLIQIWPSSTQMAIGPRLQQPIFWTLELRDGLIKRAGTCEGSLGRQKGFMIRCRRPFGERLVVVKVWVTGDVGDAQISGAVSLSFSLSGGRWPRFFRGILTTFLMHNNMRGRSEIGYGVV